MTDKTKTILWNVLKAFFIFIINSASYAFLVMNFVWAETLYYANGRAVDVSFWDSLDFKFKALVIALMVIGGVITYLLLKLFYKNFKEKENWKRQEQLEIKKEENFNKKIDKILEGKK